MDHFKKKLINTIRIINKLEDCRESYKIVSKFLRDKSGYITKNFTNFGYGLRLTNIHDVSLPIDPDNQIMEDLLEKLKVGYSNQGSLIAFRINLGTNNRSGIEDVIGPEGELDSIGLYAPRNSHHPMIYKPNKDKAPEITTIEWFLKSNQHLIPEFYSIP